MTEAREPGADDWAILRWLLPAGRPGYDAMYRRVRSETLIGLGKWGAGDYLFGPPDAAPDLSEPPARVFAFGVLEYENGALSVTVHEESEKIIEVQFTTQGIAPANAVEVRRYGYSHWSPGDRAPQCGGAVREVPMDETRVLALAPDDERVWLHDARTGINHLFPHTHLYVELMRLRSEHHPDVALKPRRLFTHVAEFGDEELSRALRNYNRSWKRFDLPDRSTGPERPKRWLASLFPRNHG